jgi:hypothetical protein
MGTKSFVQIEINAVFTTTSGKMQFRSGVCDHFKPPLDFQHQCSGRVKTPTIAVFPTLADNAPHPQPICYLHSVFFSPCPSSHVEFISHLHPINPIQYIYFDSSLSKPNTIHYGFKESGLIWVFK